MICPVCDQGNIYRAIIVALKIKLKICDECEACWLDSQKIGIENFKGLVPFLEKHGREYKKGELQNLGYLEEK